MGSQGVNSEPAAWPPSSDGRAGGAWIPAPAVPDLTEGSVHVWQANLATVGDEVFGLLSDQERLRAMRIIGREKARLWARARAVLRALLGGYLGRDPRTLRITPDIHGKPRVLVESPTLGTPSEDDPGRRLDFNLSHSGGVALFALKVSGSVGVDVELGPRRRRLDVAGVAARAFGAAERARLQKLPRRAGELELLRLWVRREAALKCLGCGPVSASYLEGAEEEPNLQPWLAELDVGPGGAAAVAVKRPPRELRYWAWRPDGSPRPIGTPARTKRS
jgi:4'-phosphopantetheinyl transferase